MLTEKVIEIDPSLKNSFQIENLSIENENKLFSITIRANKLSEYALYIYKDNEKIKTIWYTQESKFVFEAQDPGTYSFLAFAKHDSKVISKKSKQYVLA